LVLYHHERGRNKGVRKGRDGLGGGSEVKKIRRRREKKIKMELLLGGGAKVERWV